MPQVLILFDIDGTLLRTNGAGMRAMRRAAAALFGEHWKWDGITTAGHLDTLIFAEAAAINGLDDDPAHHERFRRRYLRELATELGAGQGVVTRLPGVLELLELLRGRGDVVLGMLTGNYAHAVPIKLRAAGIDPSWFTITAFADDADSRPGLVAHALRGFASRFGRPIHPRQVIVVGDTVRDVNCALTHSCLAFTVATGGGRADELRAAGAHAVVEDLSDPTPLLTLIDQATAPGEPG